MRAAPPGVWAVASALGGLPVAKAWAEKAAEADAWTFRNPSCGDREAISSLRFLAGEAPFLAVHGRLDWAHVCGADALIGGWKSLPWEILKDRAPGQCFGVSLHELEELSHAASLGVDFAFFGPIWSTPEKKGLLTPRGIDVLGEACSFGLPIIAVGGVLGAQQAAACREVGAHGVAAVRAVFDATAFRSVCRGWNKEGA